MESAHKHCILCGSRDRSSLFQEKGWHIYCCQGCGLGFLDPRPDRNELEQLYEKEYFDCQYHQGAKVGSSEMKRRLSQEKHRVKFFQKEKKEGHVVDIGCGMGYFLYAAQQYGYQVTGIDISDHASDYVTRDLQIPMLTGHINKINMPDMSVDVATMWHFLEHTENPQTYIAQVSRWLKPGGLLVIDVPNYEGTDAKKLWDHWVGWQIPYHFYHFTPSTIALILNQNGFEIIRTKDYHSEYIKEKIKKIPLLSGVARLVSKAYSGTSYAVVARKKGA